MQFLIALLFVLMVSTMFHFREVRVEALELGSVASRYIVAQVDFEFFDEEVTILRRQEAVRGLGKISRIDEKSIDQERRYFEERLMIDDAWREEGLSFDQMYQSGEMLSEVLQEMRFLDPRTLQLVEQQDLPTAHYVLFTPSKLGEGIVLPASVWTAVQKRFKGVEPKASNLLISLLKNREWVVVEDVKALEKIKKELKSQVLDYYTRVSSGSRIIDQGEVVTSRHLVILQAMKKALNHQRHLFSPDTLLGSLILSLVITVLSYFFLRVHHPELLQSNRKLFLVLTVIALTFLLAKVTELLLLTSRSNLLDVIRYPIFVPFAAILLCSLMSTAVAVLVSGFLTIFLMISLSFEGHEFIVINLCCAIVAILSTRTMRQRREIFMVCGKAWVCSAVLLLSIHLYQNDLDYGVLTDMAASAGFLLMTAVMVIGLLPLLESSFSVMTDLSLMEYMDPNHDLLRRLSIEAPGTYQHSVVVGNLAEAAALAIGANGLFCRVATLYHDIGKIMTPQYFTENQGGGMNIHLLLTPEESAQVIMAHVSEGVSLARKAGLPEQFIDVIKEHHGTTLVYYFYRQALEKSGQEAVQESDFRYPGPTPRTKESGIIMIVDSLEAASRSLDEINEESVSTLTTQIIKEKTEEGQFDRCLLTLEELATIKSVLVKTVVAYGHSRIKYPKREMGEETLRGSV